MKIFCKFLIICFPYFVFSQETNSLQLFEEQTDQFLLKYVADGYVEYKDIMKDPVELKSLLNQIQEMPLTDFSEAQRQSFYINAYNLIVIDQVVKNYPVNSVMDIPGFFDRTKYIVAGTSMSLNKIEKDILLKEYKDSRFHFVLICGAMDCPKLWKHAIRWDNLNDILESRSKMVLNDTTFLRKTNQGIGLSEIFKWNRFEFNGKEDMIEFINSYRDEPILPDDNIYYYDYDWTLNDTRFSSESYGHNGNNSYRYVTSAAVPKGGIEVKIFNNLYSQIEGTGEALDNRSTYFTSSISFLYGISNRFNLGFASRYRRVLNNQLPSSVFDVFGALSEGNGRQRVSAFGPQIRWAPFKSLSNFSIQSSFTFPIGQDLSGGSSSPFLDWSGPVFVTQFFNDKSIGDKFSLFTEIDLWIEEIGGSEKANRVSTPMTVIFSWFPKKNFTVYGLVGYSPYIEAPYDYFTQLGMGVKYQLSPQFEIEVLATDFSNRYLNSISGSAATYNIGFRYSR